MKLLSFFIIFCFSLYSTLSSGQETTIDTKDVKKLIWNKLIPDQGKVQFAGSMGMLSAGPGWYYGKKAQWETDVFIGFIPSTDNMEGHMTITFKETFSPFMMELNNSILYEPLTTGLYINKVFGHHFWDKLPAKYPENYYFWATNTRFNIFLGQALTYKPNRDSEGNWSFFYEVNTNDLYLISAWSNKIIKMTDIISLSFGVRYRIIDRTPKT